MRHVLTVPISRPPMSANEARSWHWAKQRRAKVVAESLVGMAACKANLPKNLPPSHVQVIWYPPDRRRRDPDGLSCFLKASLDSLVKYGAFQDDSSEYILSTSTRITRDGPARIEIHITTEEP